jgi:cytochrome P450 family 9
MDALLWTAIGLFVYAFYKWATANNDYFIKKGLKFAKPYFLLGSSTTFVTQHLSMPEYVSQLYNEFPNEK